MESLIGCGADGGERFARPSFSAANTQELVSDFLRKAKQLEYLITVLPTPPPTIPDGDKLADGSDPEFEELERELQAVNEDYLEALSVAGEQSSHVAAHQYNSECVLTESKLITFPPARQNDSILS